MWESRVLRRAFERLELHEGKLSRAVLRGGGGGDVTSLPDTWVGNHPGLPGPMPPRPRCQIGLTPMPLDAPDPDAPVPRVRGAGDTRERVCDHLKGGGPTRRVGEGRYILDRIAETPNRGRIRRAVPAYVRPQFTKSARARSGWGFPEPTRPAGSRGCVLIRGQVLGRMLRKEVRDRHPIPPSLY